MWAAICMLVLGHSDIWAGTDEKGAGCEPQCLSEGSGLQTSDRKQIYSMSGPSYPCYLTEFRSDKLGDLAEVMDEWKTGYYLVPEEEGMQLKSSYWLLL